MSKVFEKLVAVQIGNFCEREATLKHTISGFRKGHSTCTVLMGIRDDLLRAMKKGEVTLMVLADLSKAFDTIRCKTLITKLSTLGFSRSFLRWLTNYLSQRSHFVQIDDRKSNLAEVQFGVPQGSVLGPMLFNLYVTDLQDNLPSTATTFQYADDTTIYTRCRPGNLCQTAQRLNSTLQKLNSWSSSAQLALNPTKTQAMLLSTSQMARVHSLHENRQLLEIDEKVVQYVQQSKLLGVHFHVSKSCYSTLSILRKIKNFTGFKLRKHLVESLVFSKSDYCDTVFHPLPEFLMKRLQRLQFAAASFVKGHYVREITDIVKLGWLPVKERRDFHLLKLVHKALHSYSWPTYLELTRVNGMRTLRSSSATRLAIPLEKGTFQDTGVKLFNSLPSQLSSCREYKIFCKNTKSYLLSALQLK